MSNQVGVFLNTIFEPAERTVVIKSPVGVIKWDDRSSSLTP